MEFRISGTGEHLALRSALPRTLPPDGATFLRERWPLTKILLIRPRRIGDVLLSSPLIRALRSAFPHAELDYLTTAPCAEVLYGNPHLDRVLPYPSHGRPWTYAQVARNLFRSKYDVVIDLEGARVTARLTWVSRAPVRIGYDSSAAGWAYTHKLPEPDARRYWVLAQAELLRPLGVVVDSTRLDLFLSEWDRARGARLLERLGLNGGRTIVAMTPGSAAAHNVWPADRFAQVADHLADRWRTSVVLLYGPGQLHFARAVRNAVRQPDLCAIATTPTMREAAAVLERCTMYVGSDTGTRHVAMALGVPTVGIFGRQFPERWTPPNTPGDTAVAHDPGCKIACHYRTCVHLQCIRDIPVSAVTRAVDSCMEASASGAPAFHSRMQTHGADSVDPISQQPTTSPATQGAADFPTKLGGGLEDHASRTLNAPPF